MDQKPFMTIHVVTDKTQTSSMETPDGMVKMIPFTGTIEGEIFNGVLLPGGVDVQVTNAVGVRHMSARYMMEGTDNKGCPCKIYVENDGWFTNGEKPRPFHTIPKFFTDSENLAPYLHQNKFRGEGHVGPGQLDICFFEI